MENFKYSGLGSRRINKLYKSLYISEPIQQHESQRFTAYLIYGKNVIEILFLKNKRKIQISVYTYGTTTTQSYYLDITCIHPTEFYKVYQIVSEHIK